MTVDTQTHLDVRPTGFDRNLFRGVGDMSPTHSDMPVSVY